MAYGTPISHTVFTSPVSNGGTSSAINTLTADLIVVAVSDYASVTASALSDSKSNTYTTRTPAAGSTSRITIWYCQAPATDAAHTFTLSGSGTYSSMAIAAFAGSLASPYDVENGAFTNAGTTQATGSVTPSTNGQLLIAAVASNATPLTFTPDLGFTVIDQAQAVGGASIGVALAYLIETTAAAKNVTWTISTSGDISCAIATFKAAAAVGPTLPWLPVTRVIAGASSQVIASGFIPPSRLG